MRRDIADSARAAGRDPASVTLVGVAKGQSRTAVAEAVAAGLDDVAENYVQEARSKLDGLGGRKHFVGHVQTNKAKAIVETFDVVQSIDRLEAGRAIARAQDVLGKRVRTLVQINVSRYERFGVAPNDAPALASRLREEGLDVDGVMAIGPEGAGREATLEAFRSAADSFARVGGTTLSLGMSSDWREAVACGSTMVRIGTLLFGARA
ncbi:MAG: YggS family pyridoxal phosphate-dependent enzyme [Candidatus Eremiobacteraeota bacterium]|nr:YggS family pyridoxal phosphate-dependent enzyme [Candidatus Eremiobacteraeota bacterium]